LTVLGVRHECFVLNLLASKKVAEKAEPLTEGEAGRLTALVRARAHDTPLLTLAPTFGIVGAMLHPRRSHS
jgi:hypothetical protein